MMRLEALKLVRYMNKMGEFPATDRRTTTLKTCADLAMQRLRNGKRKAVKILALSSTMIRVLDNKGKIVEIPLQKHTRYTRRRRAGHCSWIWRHSSLCQIH